MVTNLVFVASITALLTVLYMWAFRTLQKERWQIVAAVPFKKSNEREWVGLNFTFYGVFLASAYLFSVTILFFLLGAVGAPLSVVLFLILVSVALCVPASWLLAAFVEGKRYTFTVGGAALVGLLLAPAVIEIANYSLGNRAGFRLLLIPTLAALSTCYIIGEGIGRLACISFGCCYGKPLKVNGGWLHRILAPVSFTFSGKTKKIAYESGLDGIKVIPIQALTSVLYTACGMISILLYLEGDFRSAFLVSILFAHGWRIFSETLRADFRGGGHFSAYQKMSLVSMICAAGLVIAFPEVHGLSTDIMRGLDLLWQPSVIILLQILWLLLFLVTGCSMVTESTLSFHVRSERI
jgi:hypothetical protein